MKLIYELKHKLLFFSINIEVYISILLYYSIFLKSSYYQI